MAKNWQQLLNSALAGVYPALEAMSDNELRNVRSAPKKATATNCGWLALRWAPELSEIADDILSDRAQDRRAAKKRAMRPEGHERTEAMNLVLPIKAEYFNAIKAGTKHEEFRLRTPFWRKRLEGKEFDCVVLTLGYPSRDDAARRLALPWRGMRETTITHPHFGPAPVEVYAINVRHNSHLPNNP